MRSGQVSINGERLLNHSKGFLCFEREDLLLRFVQLVKLSHIGGKLLAEKVIEAPSPPVECGKTLGPSHETREDTDDSLEVGLAGGLDALFLS